MLLIPTTLLFSSFRTIYSAAVELHFPPGRIIILRARSNNFTLQIALVVLLLCIFTITFRSDHEPQQLENAH